MPQTLAAAPRSAFGPARVGANNYAFWAFGDPSAADNAEADTRPTHPLAQPERDALDARASLVELGEVDALVPWHSRSLDARALAAAASLIRRSPLPGAAWAEAATIVELVHIDPRCHDEQARAELRLAAQWASKASHPALAVRLMKLARSDGEQDGAAPAGRDDQPRKDSHLHEIDLDGGGDVVTLPPPIADADVIAAERVVFDGLRARTPSTALGDGAHGVTLRVHRGAAVAVAALLGLDAGVAERPRLTTGLMLWNGRRVRLGWCDGAASINPAWLVRAEASADAELSGRYEAAALAALRLAQRGPTLLVMPGERAGREARAALDAAAGSTSKHSALHVVIGDATLDTLALAPWQNLIFATVPDELSIAEGRLGAWIQALGDPFVHREVRVLVGVDLRPEQTRVVREIAAAERALTMMQRPLSTAAAAWAAAMADVAQT